MFIVYHFLLFCRRGTQNNLLFLNAKPNSNLTKNCLRTSDCSDRFQYSSSRMHVMNRNWSAMKQRLHPQSVAEISRHSVLSGDRIRQYGTSSESRHKDTDQCLYVAISFCRHRSVPVPCENDSAETDTVGCRQHLNLNSNSVTSLMCATHQQDTTTYVSLGMQLDEKPSALETQLPYLGPRECVDADQVLKDSNSHVSDR